MRPESGAGRAGSRGPRRALAVLALALVGVTQAACGPPPPDPLTGDTFAFGVFGDGPYYPWERGRFRRVLADAGRSEIRWLLHVGDILWYPCSDDTYRERRAELDAVDFPVVYTPGDNEWTDCHEERPGGYEPLDRLAALRRIFFRDPGRSLGGSPLALEYQAADTAFAEFPENARWRHGGLTFATLHIVGSQNGLDPFPGRTAAHDDEVRRRTAAAIAWLYDTFRAARRDSAWGVVLVIHAEPGLTPGNDRTGYEAILDALRTHVAGFQGPVLLIHGDDHEFRIDHPLADSAGRTLANFTRLETLGSPDIGWVRVVVDTVRATFDFEPRTMRGWW